MKAKKDKKLQDASLLFETVESEDEDSQSGVSPPTDNDQQTQPTFTNNADSSFIVANGFFDELKILTKITILIAVQLIFELAITIIITIMVGNYYNNDKYLSGVGLASSFTNISGMHKILFTLFSFSFCLENQT